MRIVIGINSSGQAFADIGQPLMSFSRPTSWTRQGRPLRHFNKRSTFVHGVDLGKFEFPFGADVPSFADRDQYQELHRSKLEAGLGY